MRSQLARVPGASIARIALAALALAACGRPPPPTADCSCKPANQTQSHLRDGTPIDGRAILSELRRHRQFVADQRNPRDTKMLDDELRFAVVNFCQPCGGWVGDRMTMDELFPLARLDDAVDAVCMGLVLGDGTTVYGSARACR